MPSKKLVEIRERLAKTHQWIDDFLTQGHRERKDSGHDDFDWSKVTICEGTDQAKKDALDAKRKEAEKLTADAAKLYSVEQAESDLKEQREFLKRANPGGTLLPPRSAQQVKFDLGREVTKSQGFKNYVERGQFGQDAVLFSKEGAGMGIKDLFSSSDGWVPYPAETPDVVPEQYRRVQLLPNIRQIPTTEHSIIYNEQTTRDLTAAERSEGAAYAEADIAYTRRTVNVETVGTFLPVTREELADVPMIENILNVDLMNMLRERLDLQVIAGNGTAPNLQGITDGGNGLSGVQTLDKAAAFTVLQGIIRSMGLVRDQGTGHGSAEPSLIVMSTALWHTQLETYLAQGIGFLFGTGAHQNMFAGIPVVMHDGIPQHNSNDQMIIGDFARHCYIRDRQAASVRMENRYRVVSNATAPSGQMALTADLRAAVVWRRPAAFVLFQEIT